MVLIDFSRRRVASLSFPSLSLFRSLSLCKVNDCRLGRHTHTHTCICLSTYTHTHTHRLTWQILNCINLFLPRSFALPPYHRPCRRSTSASGPLLPLHATPTCLQAICKIDYAHKLKQTSDDIKMLLLPQGLLVTGHIYIYTALKGEWQAGGGRGNTCLCLLCFFRLVLCQIEFHSLFTYLNLRNQIQFALIVLPSLALAHSTSLSLSLPYSLPSSLVICQLTTAKCCN